MVNKIADNIQLHSGKNNSKRNAQIQKLISNGLYPHENMLIPSTRFAGSQYVLTQVIVPFIWAWDLTIL